MGRHTKRVHKLICALSYRHNSTHKPARYEFKENIQYIYLSHIANNDTQNILTSSYSFHPDSFEEIPSYLWRTRIIHLPKNPKYKDKNKSK